MTHLPVIEAGAKPAGRGAWFKIAALILVLGLVAVLAGCLNLSSEARALRDGLTQSEEEVWSEQIEIGVGSFPFALARMVLSFTEIEPELLEAARALRSAQVGFYRTPEVVSNSCHPARLLRADQSMARVGWSRLVAVMNDDDFVVVYVPETLASARNVRLCVGVLHQDQLIIVRARGDLEPLWRWARQELAKRRIKEELASLF